MTQERERQREKKTVEERERKEKERQRDIKKIEREIESERKHLNYIKQQKWQALRKFENWDLKKMKDKAKVFLRVVTRMVIMSFKGTSTWF